MNVLILPTPSQIMGAQQWLKLKGEILMTCLKNKL